MPARGAAHGHPFTSSTTLPTARLWLRRLHRSVPAVSGEACRLHLECWSQDSLDGPNPPAVLKIA